MSYLSMPYATIVGKNGIEFDSVGHRMIDDNTLTTTSGVDTINVRLRGLFPAASASLRGSIIDNGKTSVSLHVSGNILGTRVGNGLGKKYGVLMLEGMSSNLFTGNIYIEGINAVILNKYPGNTAVQKNIYARNGGIVGVAHSNQIADRSTVTLVGGGQLSEFCFYSVSYSYFPLSESFHKLEVLGECMLNFYHTDNGSLPFSVTRTLYLDELRVEEGGLLRIFNWKSTLTKLLVRKNSKYLEESLSRLAFEGYTPNGAGQREYDKDYWEIYAKLPEASSYGAVFASVACGLVLWWKRRRFNGGQWF